MKVKSKSNHPMISYSESKIENDFDHSLTSGHLIASALRLIHYVYCTALLLSKVNDIINIGHSFQVNIYTLKFELNGLGTLHSSLPYPFST